MFRIVIVSLVIVQTLAIGYLAWTLTTVARDLRAVVPANNGIPAPGGAAQTFDQQAIGSGSRASLTEETLRRLIAEQIGALSSQISSAVEANRSTPVDTPSGTTPEQARALDLVGDEIVYFSSVGSISPSEMAQLQAKIAKLDKSGQKRMLRELVKAMNEGRIEGRF